ncbi:MAG: Ig-like domain-containing protein, partial [Candidatus Dormibacteraceae bacterium]
MLLLAPMVLAACGGAPQVTAIVPARGSGSIHSDAPIQITFSTAMNERSVEQRVSLQPVADSLLSLPWIPHRALGPVVKGTFSWPTPKILLLKHPVLLPGTHYQIVLQGG